MTFTVENAKLIWRNFNGSPDAFNKDGGKRGFSIIIEDLDFARKLENDGWNIRWPKPRPDLAAEEDTRQPTISVKVSYRIRPPAITVVTSTGMKHLTEESVGSLDNVDIITCDVTVNSSYYENTMGAVTTSGISCYLSEMYIQIQESMLEKKWAQIAMEMAQRG